MNRPTNLGKNLLVGSSISLASILGTLSLSAANSEPVRDPKTPPPAPTTITAPVPGSSRMASNGGAVQNVFVDISEQMMPSVVNIFTTQTVRSRQAPLLPGDPWGELFGFPQHGAPPMGAPSGVPRHPRPTAPTAMSLGTGFVVEAGKGEGLILTNYHVIAGADEVRVKFTENSDEKDISAKVVGQDPDLDIALLKVKTERKLKAVALGDSEKLKVGEWIAAVGNPFGHGHSISHGIVSAKERTLTGGFGKYLQVDAPINPGNSGGPLVNLAGEVIGINNAIDARGPGIGFAIPINSVKALLPELKSSGHIERGYLGVNVMPLEEDLARALQSEAPSGSAVVANVAPGTPAARAGIQPYDIISKIGDKAIQSPDQLVEAVLSVPVGSKVDAEVIRRGKRMHLDLKIGARPSERT